MYFMLGMMVIIVVIATVCGVLVLQDRMRNKRRERMKKYAAVFDAKTIPDCLEAFKKVLAHLMEEEKSRRMGGKMTVTILPATYQDCYRKFHYQALPDLSKRQKKALALAVFAPVLVMWPLFSFLAGNGGSGSLYLTTVAWLLVGLVIFATFRCFYRRTIHPEMEDEMKILHRLDSKIELAIRGQFNPDASSPVTQEYLNPKATDDFLHGDVPPWAAGLIIGVFLLMVGSIFFYGTYINKQFEVEKMPGYDYITHQPWRDVEAKLAKLDPEEDLTNLHVDGTKTRHLIGSSFTPPDGCVCCEMPETSAVAEMEAFVHEHEQEFIDEAAAREFTVDKISVFPLECGYVAVRLSGTGYDIVNGSKASIEQVTFKRKKTCYRVTLANCGNGDLSTELSLLPEQIHFK